MKFGLTIILMMCFSTQLFSISSNGINKHMAFQAGEELVYSVHYKVGVNVEVATVTFSLADEKRDGKDNYHLNVVGRVRPSFRWLFDIYDVYNVWIDKSSMQPTYFENNLNEGTYKFKSSYTYNWEEKVVHTWAHNPNFEAKFQSFPLTKDSFDALSMLYKLRTLDITNIKKDKVYNLNVVFDDRIRNVGYRFVGREDKLIKGYGIFKVLVFVCSLATDDGKPYEDGGEFTIMFSDDKNKIPVAVLTPIKVGSVRVALSSAEGLLHPMSSLIKPNKKNYSSK